MRDAAEPMQLARNRWRIISLLILALGGGVLAMRGLNDDVRPGEVAPYDGPALSAAEPTTPDPAAWSERWDAEVGLWWQHHAGHTRRVAQLPRVHPAPSAAARLLLAAQARRLQSVDVSAVLGALRRMQVLKGDKMHGCMRWYWEEKWPDDQNASFFTGMSLIALDRCYAEQLEPEQREALRAILKDLGAYFRAEADERRFFYPNRCLGDLAGAWLIGEITGEANVDADGSLRRIMLDAADYWETRGWGWGEHLSDTYAGVCLDNISALLLLSRHLPDDVRARYKRLFDDLLAIDDAFAAQPRVPAIRSYAFGAGPTHTGYRERIRPLSDDVSQPLAHQTTPLMPPEAGDVFQHRPPLGATFHAHGWHDLAPMPSTSATRQHQRDLVIPCQDAIAWARIREDVRLGSVSRFPLSPDAESHAWGMSWQSFPVALWRPTGDWGFLQWETRAGDRVRAHPAIDMLTAYPDNALTPKGSAITVGRTYAIQRGGDVIALRIMPAIAPEWDHVVDRWRLLGSTAEIPAPVTEPSHAQLLLRYPQRDVSVQCVPLSPGGVVGFGEPSCALDWGVRYDRAALSKLRTVVVLWGVSMNGRVGTAPVIAPAGEALGSDKTDDERPLEVRWAWPQTQWHLRIDPRDSRPLQDWNTTANGR